MNRIDLEGRVAVVTGGAQGIGYAVAERFVASGARVWLWDRDAPLAREAAAALGGGVREIVVDQTDAAAVVAAADAVVEADGRIDILVANAGIAGPNGTLWEFDPAVWRQVIDVNLNGVYHCCRAVVPHMLRPATAASSTSPRSPARRATPTPPPTPPPRPGSSR